jgi:aldehyde dehydrogenase
MKIFMISLLQRSLKELKAIKLGNPLDMSTMMGTSFISAKEKIMSYLKLGKEEGAELLTGGDQNMLEVIYREDTIFNQRYSKGITKCVFSREIFGPVLAVTTFKTTEEAIAIANDTMYGLGAGLWTRDAHEIYQVPRAIQAGRVWVNQYHYHLSRSAIWWIQAVNWTRKSKMMLGHYRQTKNMLISYDKNKLGFF